MGSSNSVISHWHHSLENFTTSTLDFYSSVEGAIRLKEAPIVKTERVEWHESGVLSAKREYLRISYGRFSFDLCAAPFGKDYFFSWWLVRRRASNSFIIGCAGLLVLFLLFWLLAALFGSFVALLISLAALTTGILMVRTSGGEAAIMLDDAILGLPVIGMLYQRFIKPTSYYSEDTRIMFEEFVHRIVSHEVQTLVGGHGAMVLSPEQLKPQSKRPIA